jgi:signal transduction histidine kinase
VVSSFAALPLELLGISQLGSSYFFQAIIFNVALSSLLFVYQMVKIQVLISQENLQQVVVKLEALTAALRQEAWVIQRNIATVLHGPVQAAMYAAALKLSSLKRPSEKVNQSVKSEIDSAIAKLSKPDFLEGESLRAVLEQIQELWSGICEVQIELPQDLDSDLTKRPIVAQCVLEIAREGVSNAVKHGKAKNISIQIAEAQNDFLRISVTNDGAVPETGSELGVGSTLLDELSHSWEIKSRKGLTELRALVSLAKRD